MTTKKATTEVKEVKDKKAPEQAEVKAVAEETVAVESKISKKLDKGRVYVKASYNNTLISITDEKGNLIAWSSAGSLGFAGPKKATPFAASKIIAALAEKVKKSGPLNVSVFVSGVGGGRDSAIRSLANQGFNILSIKDVTPIPHNGPKPPKVRRV